MVSHNDRDRVRRAIEEIHLDADNESASTARMFALLIVFFGGVFGVVAVAFIVSLLSQRGI